MGHSYNVFRVKTVDSTNTVAKNGYAKGLYNSGAVIVADSQMEGRGQLRTKWHDESGKNLLMTLILEPYKLPARSFFRLNEAVSLALTDVLPVEYLPKIKWPNDIFLNGLKTAGILIETQIANEEIKTAFIGIGLNVNQEVFPKSFDATSIKIESGLETRLDDLLNALLDALEFRMQQLQLPELLSRMYKNRLMGVDQFLRYEDEKGEFIAQVNHVEEDGRLVLEVSEEPVFRYYQFKEVKLIGA